MAPTLPIYLDNHSTTRCDPEVIRAMMPFFGEQYGNAASRSHRFGFEAKSAVEIARERVATLLGVSPKEIIWTSGATEANNLAILGVARANQKKGRHIITSSIEHKAVLDACTYLERSGWQITRLSPGRSGLITAEQVEHALTESTVLVTIMAANNEVGTLQPIQDIGAICQREGVVFHTDAVQAAGRISLQAKTLHADLISLSAHKMYGPKGVGVLYVRRGRPRIRLEPLFHGGGHERGLRSGTLAVPLIVGMGESARLAMQALANGEVDRLRELRDRLWLGLQEKVENISLNGDLVHRLPNNLNVSFAQVEAEALMMALRDIAVSSGSACTSASLEPSYVLRAMGVDPELAHASIRFGVGRFNTAEEIDFTIDLIAKQVQLLREMSPLYST